MTTKRKQLNELILPDNSRVTVLKCGARIDSEITRKQWRSIGSQIGAVRDNSMWWIGDWIRAGEQKWGEVYDEAMELTGLAYQTLANAAWVCEQFSDFSLRREKLSFFHHKCVAGRDDKHELLQWAEENEASSRALRDAIAEQKRLEQPSDEKEDEGDENDNEQDEEVFASDAEESEVESLDDDEGDDDADYAEGDEECVDDIPIKNWYTVEQWEALPKDEQELALDVFSEKTFNKQDNASIEWAQWSWNPVTGCKHDCPYCYARDIAHRFYPQKFEPSLYPERLQMPQRTKVPEKAEQDTAFRNVFTCSMADLFGRWVPLEWIDMVLEAVADAPDWNFLFLTKFPQRLSEVGEIPSNAWMGTTVDCQDRVANAEKAFAKLDGGVKWLSVEPMLTPLDFSNLEMFDWVVIGGASGSRQTPAWVPPFDWVVNVHNAARAAGCAIYHKDNLGMSKDMRLREFPWEPRRERELPEQLKYLGMQ